MSMIGNVLRVTEAELEDYFKDSSLLLERINQINTADENFIDLDKAWDGIIFLLTGQSIMLAEDPLIDVLFSGQHIDEDQDVGYGPAHYLTAEQVVELNNQICNISKADLKLRFDAEKMTELSVYPHFWEEGDEDFNYIADAFAELQNIYAKAAKNGEAIITFLN